jgi:haloalkane dehalogenase
MPQIDVLDSTIHYEETGSGTPFVYLHGNPVSSHVWRNVLPHVPGRRIAPDQIGMGRSGKPALDYTFADHARYLEAFLDALELDAVVLVGIDWGGALAFDWAARHPSRVRGLAFMETIVRPLSTDDLTPASRPRLAAFRTPGEGERLVLEENAMLDGALRATVLTPLSDEDQAVYRAPYPTPESRRPMLEWPRAFPVDGEPADVVARFESFGEYLRTSPIPKLLLTFEGSPTLLIGPELTQWCEDNIGALEVEACGTAAHMAPEDRPAEIAAALTAWAHRRQLI